LSKEEVPTRAEPWIVLSYFCMNMWFIACLPNIKIRISKCEIRSNT
jgi:hypothetical protein